MARVYTLRDRLTENNVRRVRAPGGAKAYRQNKNSHDNSFRLRDHQSLSEDHQNLDISSFQNQFMFKARFNLSENYFCVRISIWMNNFYLYHFKSNQFSIDII